AADSTYSRDIGVRRLSAILPHPPVAVAMVRKDGIRDGAGPGHGRVVENRDILVRDRPEAGFRELTPRGSAWTFGESHFLAGCASKLLGTPKALRRPGLSGAGLLLPAAFAPGTWPRRRARWASPARARPDPRCGSRAP